MKVLNVNLESYKIFYFVAKYKGITAAAEKLCISQPAVSQAVKQLEQNLGVQLFLRTPKGAKLTAEGEVLYGYISQGYETILLGEMKLKELINMEAGEIRIGASDMTLRYYLLPFLERFHQMYPAIKVSVTNGPTPETLSYLEQGKIDFGVVTTPVQKTKDRNVFKTREIQDIFVAGSNFWRLKNQLLDYDCLTKFPVICLEPNTSTRAYVDHWLFDRKVVLAPEIELATSDMIIQFAVRNFGLGCVVRDFALEEMEKGHLFELQFATRIPKRHMCVVSSQRNPVSRAAKLLWNMMLAEVEK